MRIKSESAGLTRYLVLIMGHRNKEICVYRSNISGGTPPPSTALQELYRTRVETIRGSILEKWRGYWDFGAENTCKMRSFVVIT